MLEREDLSLLILKTHQNISSVTVMELRLAVNHVEVPRFTLLSVDSVLNKAQVSSS